MERFYQFVVHTIQGLTDIYLYLLTSQSWGLFRIAGCACVVYTIAIASDSF